MLYIDDNIFGRFAYIAPFCVHYNADIFAWHDLLFSTDTLLSFVSSRKQAVHGG